ncbi:MAG: hypothetical protein V8T90_05135 [Victivallales bacterium]
MKVLLILLFLAVAGTWLIFLCRKRNKKRSDIQELAALQKIAKALPRKYANVAKQADADLWKESILLGGMPDIHALVVQFADAREEASYYDNTFPHYMVLRNIHAKNRKTDLPVDIELYLNRGVLIHYRSTSPLNELDTSTVDCSGLEEQTLHDNAPETVASGKIAELFRDASPEQLAQLEIGDSYEIELEEGIFYPIKQYESGNILAVNDNGAIFLLRHDPYEVRQLYPSPAEFLAACNSSVIDPEDEESLQTFANPTSWR